MSKKETVEEVVDMLTGIPAPRTPEEIDKDVAEFGPWTQVTYKAVVLHNMFDIPFGEAIAEARRYGLNSEDAFFAKLNMLYSMLGSE